MGHSLAQRISAVVAVLFGLVTIAAGASVLAGRDPGYIVYRPLLIFNTLMGVGYVAAGILAWRRARSGRNAAVLIVGLNLLVLGRVIYLYRTGSLVALDSVRAMAFRTAVWLVLLLAFAWAGREPRSAT